MGEKPFRTTDELINLLSIERGLIIDSDTKHIIDLEGYYPIINGYKDMFLKQKEPDLFIDGCHFNDIYSLFCMDRELRFLMLRKLIKIEQRIKTTICRVFSENYQDTEAYLDEKSYSNHNPKMLEDLINMLSDKRNSQKSYLSHYREKHKDIPIWVLSNNLTFGNIKYLYFCLDFKVKQKIAKDLSINIVLPHTKKPMFYKELEEIITVSSFFRNICAHDERMFNEKATFYNKQNSKNNKYYSFIDMYNMIMKLLLPTEKTFLKEKFKYIINHEFKFSNNSIKIKILKEMGIDSNKKNSL